MTSHIPFALSLLGAVASGLQGSGVGSTLIPPPPPPSTASAPPSAPQQNSSSLPAPSAPVNVPGSTVSTFNASANGLGASPPSNNLVALCVYCQLRPKYFDGTKTHPYCSKSCANKIKASNPKTGSGATNGNCDFCHNRPKYNDGTRTHDFCSKACARSAGGPQRRSTMPGAGANSKAVCQAPGCQNPPHGGPGSDYCSMAHKTLGETLCLMCLQAPKMANSHFCSQTCIDDVEAKGPMILEVPLGHATFKSVAEQFKSSWRHYGSACPPVRRIYKIISPPTSLVNYNAYRAAVESRGQFLSAGRTEGNENRRWHGTRRCSLCCIIRNSFDLSLFGKKTGWGRFGKGIYTSSTSSKSNDYSHNDCQSSLKAILLNKVVVGKGCKLLQDNTTLTSPPSGFDSVLAEKGGSLNYDELVVYTNDAIRPSFLVMYEP